MLGSRKVSFESVSREVHVNIGCDRLRAERSKVWLFNPFRVGVVLSFFRRFHRPVIQVESLRDSWSKSGGTLRVNTIGVID